MQKATRSAKRWTRPLLDREVQQAWAADTPTSLLEAYAQVWERKPILRTVYGAWYERVRAWIEPGRILEVGAGTGHFARWLHPRRVVTLDVLRRPGIGVQGHAQCLPIRDASVRSLVMIDVLHHLPEPPVFLHEASRVLAPGGRLIVVEPFVSAWGWMVYRWLHHEDVDFNANAAWRPSDPWHGNAAVSRWLLHESREQRLPLPLRAVEYGDVLSYPLSGGVSYRAMLPDSVLRWLHRAEQHPFARNRWISLRMLAVLEKPGA